MRFGRAVLTIPLFQVKSSNCEPLWGDGRKEKCNFDDKKCFFDILSFSNFSFLKYLLTFKKKQNCWMTKCRKNNYFRRMRFFRCVHRPKGVRNSMISLGIEVLWALYDNFLFFFKFGHFQNIFAKAQFSKYFRQSPIFKIFSPKPNFQNIFAKAPFSKYFRQSPIFKIFSSN